MTHADFVHLRVHSAFSLSEGAIKVKDLAALCAKMRMPAVAITDTNNLFGALEFSQACWESGVQPIIGCQLGIAREAPPEGAFAGRDLRKPDPDPLVLLAQNKTGYRNLMGLVSHAYLETPPGERPQVSIEHLCRHTEGLILLTGGHAGPVGRLLSEGQSDAARAVLARLAEAFAGRLYVEVQRHGLAVQRKIEPTLIELADALDIPLVATNEAFFATRDMFEAHDALICIAEGAYQSQQDRRRLTPEHHLKWPQDMRALFADLPEALDNTLVVARRCAFRVETVHPILPPFATESGRGEAEELRVWAHEGLAERLAVHVHTPEMDEPARKAAAKPYVERLDYELDVIEEMGFPGYFLIVSDFIRWAKARGIPVGPGRGSGAGSVAAWALTITDLDPLRFGLLFERFLNPERVSMPDFDIDFCQDRREEVIRYVQDKYGHDKVAQIITFGKLQARAVLRDVGRVLQMPYGQVDKLCKLVPNNPANPVTLAQAIESEPDLRRSRDTDETVGRLIDIALKLEGLYRHASTHAAGVVIGDRPLHELVALYRDPRSDMPVTQFNMKHVEQAGLVKFDFLGLKTLTVLARALDLIEGTTGQRLDLSALPLDDPRTFEILGRGETAGVFQLESAGMRDVLRGLKPDSLEDIIAVVALYRPGPMDNIPSYIKRKHGEEAIEYLHPDLEPILAETNGIMIYQEQVMQAAQVLAGYTLGGADLLRRAMGKKIKAEMDQQRQVFTEGCVARGIPQAKADEIFDQIAKFAGYGFNKSHAAAYALIAYQTAYLKANHPVEFMAASMTLDLHNTDKLNAFRQELDRLEIALLPPDINRSEVTFSVEDGAVRYALAAVRNVGEAACESIIGERAANGPFADIADFTRRVDAKVMNRRQMENLIKAGAFDALEPNRRRLFEGAETLLRHAAMAAEERTSDQASLFGGGAMEETGPNLPDVPDWTPMDRLAEELDAIGFYLSAHPLDAYGSSLERLHVVRAADLSAHIKVHGQGMVKMAGTVLSRKERIGRSGGRYAFVTLSDATGVYEIMLFSEVLHAARDLLESGKPVLVGVIAQVDGEQIRLQGQTVESLDAAVARTTRGLKIVFSGIEPLPRLKEIIAKETPGRGEVILVPQLEGGIEVEMPLKTRYAISAGIIGALKNIPGIIEVREI